MSFCGLVIFWSNGDVVKQLTYGSNDGLPAWSPDGQKIAFSRPGIGLDIHVIDVDSDGTDAINISNSSGNDSLPVWTPDSEQIVFRTTRDGGWRIYLMDADGANQRPLIDGYVGAHHDYWGYERMSIVEMDKK